MPFNLFPVFQAMFYCATPHTCYLLSGVFYFKFYLCIFSPIVNIGVLYHRSDPNCFLIPL
jgi:hypothetical protein